MSDRELVQLVCALRITFPQSWASCSARAERAPLRDGSIGVTLMSAGSHTEPRRLHATRRKHLHRTVRGRIVAPEYQDGEDQLAANSRSATASPAEIACGSFATEDWNRFGKIGIRLLCAHQDRGER